MPDTTANRAPLGPQDWIDAAMVLLAERGVDGVKVDVLARRIGITRGSFYWHFPDRAALLREMREHWAFEATEAVIDEADALGAPPRARLRDVLSRWTEAMASAIERAMRDWARTDPAMADRLAAIDRRRLAYLEGLVWAAGVAPERAGLRALLLYGLVLAAAAGTVLPPGDASATAHIDPAIDLALTA